MGDSSKGKLLLSLKDEKLSKRKRSVSFHKIFIMGESFIGKLLALRTENLLKQKKIILL